MSQVCRVRTFIDWDTARRIVPPDVRHRRRTVVDRAVQVLQNAIAALLTARIPTATFRVSMRVYHGWYRGKTPTDDRRDFDVFRSRFTSGRVIDRVSFLPEISYGDELLCGSQRARLFDTLRKRDDGRDDEQKMVDTALVSDLLHEARMRNFDLGLVIGDDDDLLPGAFTADAWGASVLVARLRPYDSHHLRTEGLIVRLRQP